jgi:hypothetical protein
MDPSGVISEFSKKSASLIAMAECAFRGALHEKSGFAVSGA